MDPYRQMTGPNKGNWVMEHEHQSLGAMRPAILLFHLLEMSETGRLQKQKKEITGLLGGAGAGGVGSSF